MDLSDALHEASGTRAALELRVLSGRQAGARALLPSDGAWTRLGRLETNDLVLRDAPFDQAEVGLQDGQWLWRQPDGSELPLQSGQGVRLGEFVLLLCRPSAPWVEEWPAEWAIDAKAGDDPEPSGAQSSPADPSSPAAQAEAPGSAGAEVEGGSHVVLGERIEPVFDAVPDTNPAPANAGVEAEPQAAPQRVSARARHLKVAAASVGAVSVLATALWLVGPWGGAREPGDGGSGLAVNAPRDSGSTGGTTAAPVMAPAASDLEAVSALLAESAAAAPGVKAVVGADGRVALRGVVRDDEALETVLRPIIRAGVRVSLQVMTAREFDLRAQTLARQLPKGLSVQALPDGTIRVQGEVAGDEVLPGLQALAVQEVPEALGVQWAVSTASARRELERQAQQVDAQRLSRLPPVAPLPEVVSVIGGGDAHIVLADGLRVSPGGSAGAWRLLSVGDSAVTFADAHGRQRRLAL